MNAGNPAQIGLSVSPRRFHSRLLGVVAPSVKARDSRNCQQVGSISGCGAGEFSVAEEIDADRDAFDDRSLTAHEDAIGAGLAGNHEVVPRVFQAPAELFYLAQCGGRTRCRAVPVSTAKTSAAAVTAQLKLDLEECLAVSFAVVAAPIGVARNASRSRRSPAALSCSARAASSRALAASRSRRAASRSSALLNNASSALPAPLRQNGAYRGDSSDAGYLSVPGKTQNSPLDQIGEPGHDRSVLVPVTQVCTTTTASTSAMTVGNR